MDAQNKIVIDLNDYGQEVGRGIGIFNEKVAALIKFSNDYITFIDRDGKFLFDPIKTNGFIHYYEDAESVVFIQDGNYYYLNINGDVKPIDLKLEEIWDEEALINKLYPVESNGKKYWIADGNHGIQIQERF